MGVEMEVAENGHVILSTYSDPWSLDEAAAIDKQEIAYMDSVQHPVHLLIDVRNVRHLPQGMLRVRAFNVLYHPNRGKIVMVGASNILKTLSEVILKLSTRENVPFFSTLEEGQAHLKKLVESEQPQS